MLPARMRSDRLVGVVEVSGNQADFAPDAARQVRLRRPARDDQQIPAHDERLLLCPQAEVGWVREEYRSHHRHARLRRLAKGV